MSENEAVGVILGFECSVPPPKYQPPPSHETAHPIPPFPTLMPTRYEDVCGVSRWDTSNLEEVLDWEECDDFTFVGWSYERKPPKRCFCVKCGGTKFLVGSSEACMTIIKCPECGWERVVHDG